jgi:hypothetical protein
MEDNTNTNGDSGPQDNGKGPTKDELIEQLDNFVKYFDSLPVHEKFSFATNADLYYPLLLIVNILKRI